MAGFLLGDTFDRLFNWPVLYVWVTGSLIAYILQLIGLSRFMLPPSARHYRTDDALLDGSPATREGMYLLMFYAFIIRLFPERLRRLMGLHLTTVPPGVDDSFTRYQAGMVDSHLALVLARGTSVTRAAGPGYVRLERFERILQAVDLRTQFRAQNASVTTRDGIPLTTVATAMFQVRAGRPVEEDQPDTLPYPYEDSTVFRLTYADSAGEEEVIHWSERLCPKTVGQFVVEEEVVALCIEGASGKNDIGLTCGNPAGRIFDSREAGEFLAFQGSRGPRHLMHDLDVSSEKVGEFAKIQGWTQAAG